MASPRHGPESETLAASPLRRRIIELRDLSNNVAESANNLEKIAGEILEDDAETARRIRARLEGWKLPKSSPKAPTRQGPHTPATQTPAPRKTRRANTSGNNRRANTSTIPGNETIRPAKPHQKGTRQLGPRTSDLGPPQ